MKRNSLLFAELKISVMYLTGTTLSTSCIIRELSYLRALSCRIKTKLGKLVIMKMVHLVSEAVGSLLPSTLQRVDGYHYEDRYWDIFDCVELERAKPWDGYKEEQVTRLLSLRQTVDHPSHYNKPGRKECIEEMLDEFGPEAVYWFCKLNAYKYEYRAGDKGSADVDLNKAAWYSKYAHNLTKRFDILELNTGGTQE
jgi:hypothetical protein